MLGLGVDDMFLFIRTLFNVMEKPEQADATPEQLVAEVYAHVGPSVVLTTITNFCAFMVGTLTPLPVVRDFALTASITVVILFVTDFIGFPALCVISLKYFPNVSIWNACCAKKEVASSEIKPAETKQSKELEASPQDRMDRALVKNYVVPFLANNFVRIGVVVFFCGLWALSAYGMTKLEQGLSTKEITKDDTQEQDFISVRDAYFGFYPSHLSAYENDFSDPEVQSEYMDVVEKVIALEKNTERTQGWLKDFLYWADPDKCETSAIVELCGAAMYPPCLVNPLLSFGDDGFKLFDAGEEDFFRCLNLWNSQTTVTSGPSFNPLSNGAKGGDKIEYPLQFCNVPFYTENLFKTPDYVDLIEDVRKIVDDSSLKLYPRGTVFTYWEQYRNLAKHLTNNLLLATFCTFVIGTIAIVISTAAGTTITAPLLCVHVLKGMQGSFLMTIAIASTIFTLLGFMGLADIPMSAIPALTVIASMGICVDLTALVTLFFCSSPGTRDERIKAALDSVFIPTLDSCTSTIMGCLALAFSQVPLFVKFFFVMYVLVAVIGALNGLILLPVMLTVLGPTYTHTGDETDLKKTSDDADAETGSGL